MKRIRYQVACSLDGYIAGPNDEFDWIIPEPAFDFDKLYDEFDTLLMGRRTFEIMRAGSDNFHGKRIVVASRSLRQMDHPEVEIVGDDLETRLKELREESGRDIWLYGGADLFAQLLSWHLVDSVEPAIIPILLGGGVKMLTPHGQHQQLDLVRHRTYPSGMILLEYKVANHQSFDRMV